MEDKFILSIISKKNLQQIHSVEITKDQMEWLTLKDRRNESKRKYRFRIFEISVFIFLITAASIMFYAVKLEDKIDFLEKSNISLQESLQKENDELLLNHLIGKYTTYKGDIPINDSVVYATILEAKAWYPDIIFAQYKIESASGTSNLYRNTNNLFGMKQVFTRKTTQIPNKQYNSYGVYKNWQCSILDRVLWDIYTFKDRPSKEEYLNSLVIYAEDSSYITKIKSLI